MQVQNNYVARLFLHKKLFERLLVLLRNVYNRLLPSNVNNYYGEILWIILLWTAPTPNRHG